MNKGEGHFVFVGLGLVDVSPEKKSVDCITMYNHAQYDFCFEYIMYKHWHFIWNVLFEHGCFWAE